MRPFPSDLPLTAPSSVSRRRTGAAGDIAASGAQLLCGIFRACFRSACFRFACMRSVGAPRALCHAGHRSVLQTGILQRSGPNGTFARLLRFLARRCRMWCRHVRDCATHGGALSLRALVGPSVRDAVRTNAGPSSARQTLALLCAWMKILFSTQNFVKSQSRGKNGECATPFSWRLERKP